MEYSELIARIVAVIKENGNKEITGDQLQGVLFDMVGNLGSGYQFGGIVTPLSNPGRPDAKMLYLAFEAGEYEHLGGLALNEGMGIFTFDSAWHLEVIEYTEREYIERAFEERVNKTTAQAEVDLKADELTPVVPPMVTGSARGILGRSAAARFLYRQTSSGSGAAWLRSIHGRTVSYNQLVRNGDFSGNISGWVAYYSENVSVAYGNHSIIATMISSIGGYAAGIRTSILPIIPIGHKALIEYEVKCSVNCAFGAEIGNMNIVAISATANQWTKISGITAGVSRLGNSLILKPQTVLSIDDTYEIRNVIVTDLTKAGLDSIITTPAEFEAWQMKQFGHKGYLGYTPGKLVNVNPTGVLTTGRNVWDEELEEGLLNVDGTVTPASGRYCSKNHIPCGLASKYYFYLEGGNNFNTICYYDANFALVGYEQARKGERTIPSGAVWAKFGLYSTYTGGHICINISDPTFNGQYEPYNGHTLPLDFTEHFPTGMNGVNGIYDEVVSDENGKFTDGDKRFGIVDLGSLTWDYNNVGFFYAPNIGAKPVANNTTLANILCGKYKTYTASEIYNNTYGNGIGQEDGATTCRLRVRDSAYTDAATFKAAMSGVPLVYELATPQHVTFTDPSDAVYPVTEGGTEQVLPVNGKVPTTISPDMTLQMPRILGKDTPTIGSLDNLVAAVAQKIGRTITKEWDNETHSYQFEIQ